MVKPYVDKIKYKEIETELLSLEYSSFCQKINDTGLLKNMNLLSSIKDAIFYKNYHSLMRKQSKDSNIESYLSILEIVLFISLVEGYMDDGKYLDLSRYLSQAVKNAESVTGSEMRELISKYNDEYSLSAKVRAFMNKAPILDKMYLSASKDQDEDLKIKHRGFSFLMVMLKKQQYFQKKFEFNRALKKKDILLKILDSLKGKGDKVHLAEVAKELKQVHGDDELMGILKNISNQLYDIRSKFLHTDSKEDDYSFSLDLEKGNIFDFKDIDFFRYFIRTILFDSGFDIDMVAMSSKSSF